MPRYHRAKDVRNVQLTALERGGKIRYSADGLPTRTVEWDLAGNCLRPKKVELHGRAEKMIGQRDIVVSKDNRPNFVELDVRCRQCVNCLRQRGYVWYFRAKTEWRLSQRTWLATFTLNPETVFYWQTRLRHELAAQGFDYDVLPVDEQFRLLEAEGYLEVQKWLRSVRKRTGCTIRYLCVTEAHKSGLPHWHLLIHEKDKPLRHSTLKGSWSWGFDSYKLVQDAAGAGYAAKYLGKDIKARVRASLLYGTEGTLDGGGAVELPSNHALTE